MDAEVDSVGLIYWRRKEKEIDGGKGGRRIGDGSTMDSNT